MPKIAQDFASASSVTQRRESRTSICLFESPLIKEVIGEKFLSDDFKRKFLNDYVGDLYKVADEDLLAQIEKDTTSVLIPIKRQCEHCGEMMEVYVQPSLRFQQ